MNNVEFKVEVLTDGLGDLSKLQMLKKDSDGYYVGIILGAIGSFNAAGEYYVYSREVVNTLINKSIMGRRCKSGDLYAEVTHPSKWDLVFNKLSELDKRRRGLDIDMRFVCAHFKAVYVDPKPTKVPGQSRPVYLIRGDLKPIGPYKTLVEDSLNTNSINTAFSIRSFITPRIVGGVKWKTIVEATTFDLVLQPGMQGIANKFSWSMLGDNSRSPVDIVTGKMSSEMTDSYEAAELDSISEYLRNSEESVESELLKIEKELYCDNDGVCALLAVPNRL